MIVLQLVQKPQLRGAEMFASQLATHINESTHKAILVFVFDGTAPLPFTGTTKYLHGNPLRRMWDVAAWRRLAQIIIKEQPDVVQANAGDTLKYAVFSKMLFGWKQPIVFRNASTISLYIKSMPARMLNGFFFRRAKRIISVSNTSAADFAKLFPAYKKKIVTIPIGIEQPEAEQFAEKEPLLANVSRPVLLHVGGFTYEKNHLRLIEMFGRICEQQPGATLHLVGDGPMKQQVQEGVQQKGLASKVTFYGFRNDAMQFMKEADALLLPSIIEGLPGVILEAFYCKIPVVAYDVGGIGEVVKNNQTGRLVPKGNEEDFVTAVQEAVQQTPVNAQMTGNAWQLVTGQYLNTHIAKQFLKVYETII